MHGRQHRGDPATITVVAVVVAVLALLGPVRTATVSLVFLAGDARADVSAAHVTAGHGVPWAAARQPRVRTGPVRPPYPSVALAAVAGLAIVLAALAGVATLRRRPPGGLMGAPGGRGPPRLVG
jgi:hypothetical protein